MKKYLVAIYYFGASTPEARIVTAKNCIEAEALFEHPLANIIVVPLSPRVKRQLLKELQS